MGFWKKAGLIGLGCLLSLAIGGGLEYLVESYEMTLSEPFPWFDTPEDARNGLSGLFKGKRPFGMMVSFLFAGLLGPVMEEILFRSWLRRNRVGFLLVGLDIAVYAVSKFFPRALPGHFEFRFFFGEPGLFGVLCLE